jgi:hypothetical protein
MKTATCINCGKSFPLPPIFTIITCSPRCRAEHEQKILRARLQKVRTHTPMFLPSEIKEAA